MSFSELGLCADLMRAIAKQGYSEATPIQAQAIPAMLDGQDILAAAQTGTGKTAAFTLPLLHRLAGRRERKVAALVLTPTRELAQQVYDSVRTYGCYLPLRATTVYGGVSIQMQVKALRRGVDIVVATPGRLIDHLTRRTVDLSGVELVVLDEADRMLDMGFLPDIERILSHIPAARQTALFSATFSPTIKKLATRYLRSPRVVEIARPNTVATAIAQSVYRVDCDKKRNLLSYMMGSQNMHQVLVFTRTKRGADRLAVQLKEDGISAAAIHGDKSQGARQRALLAFKQHKVRALVATDVAARGLDINKLSHVVNYELPDDIENYVHRIGRTGRAGHSGSAISLVCAQEQGQFRAIERLLNTRLPTSVMAGFEPTAKAEVGSQQMPRRKPRRHAQPPRNNGHKPAQRRSPRRSGNVA